MVSELSRSICLKNVLFLHNIFQHMRMPSLGEVECLNQTLNKFDYNCCRENKHSLLQVSSGNKVTTRDVDFWWIPSCFLVPHSINVTPLPFLQYSPLIEFSNQFALGEFQKLEALFWQDLPKYTLSNSDASFWNWLLRLCFCLCANIIHVSLT